MRLRQSRSVTFQLWTRAVRQIWSWAEPRLVSTVFSVVGMPLNPKARCESENDDNGMPVGAHHRMRLVRPTVNRRKGPRGHPRWPAGGTKYGRPPRMKQRTADGLLQITSLWKRSLSERTAADWPASAPGRRNGYTCRIAHSTPAGTWRLVQRGALYRQSAPPAAAAVLRRTTP